MKLEAAITLNIINTQEIDNYLQSFCGDDVQLQTFLISALQNVIKKNPAYMDVVSELPEESPPWLRDKWNTQKSWHKFSRKKDIRLAGKVNDVVNWLKDAIEYKMDWINQVDDLGRPKKLLKISSLEHLESVQQKDQQQIDLKISKLAERELEVEGQYNWLDKVMSFDDGHYIVRLATETALDTEGAYLGHCIGRGGYDYALSGNVTEFYSLRNKDNLPCVSMSISKDNRCLVEVSGRRNSHPKSKFIPYIATFCRESFVDMANAFCLDEGYEFLSRGGV